MSVAVVQGLNICNLMPPEILIEIFQNLSLVDLLSISQVCRQWKGIVKDNPKLIEEVVKRSYRAKIYGPEIWGKPDDWRRLGIDPRGAPPINPIEVGKIAHRFSKSISKKVGITIFPIPQNLTINKVILFAESSISGHPVAVRSIWSKILEEIGDKPVDHSYFVVMTTGPLKNSRKYFQMKWLQRDPKLPGQMPTLIEGLAQFVIMDKNFTETDPKHKSADYFSCYFRFKDRIGLYSLVGGLSSSGLCARRISYFDAQRIGVIGLHRLISPESQTQGG